MNSNKNQALFSFRKTLTNIFQKLVSRIKNLTQKQKILLGISTGIILLAVIILTSFFALKASGKKHLYSKASSAKPYMTTEASQTDASMNSELIINPDDMGDVAEITETAPDNSEETKTSDSTEGNLTESDASEPVSENTDNQNDYSVVESNENEDGEFVLENSPQQTTSGYIVQAPEGASYDIIYQGTKYKYNQDILTHLVLGIDKRDVVSPAADGISGGQSDAMFLVVMNPHTSSMKIIAIPRDTIAKIDVYDRSGSYVQSGYAQICLQHGYGDGMSVSNERAKSAVSSLFYNLPIHSVTSVNMGAIPGINDAVGGITLESLYTFSDEGWNFVKGQTIHLEGTGAYSYIHYRDTSRHYTAPERLERQKQYITLFTDQALQRIQKNIATVVNIYQSVQDYVVTDLGINDMTYLASEISGYHFDGITSLQGTVDISQKYERYYLDMDAFYQLMVDTFYEPVA